jgi:murein DD-endopeptidase MepM/ murein hydrolase activator NlpD
VKGGESVRIGDKLGKTGSTGVGTAIHLHFEVRKNNKMHCTLKTVNNFIA